MWQFGFLIQRNGADFSVFVNTGQEFDGSDSGARPDEAVSWGKIKMTASPVKVKNNFFSLSFEKRIVDKSEGSQGNRISEWNLRENSVKFIVVL